MHGALEVEPDEADARAHPVQATGREAHGTPRHRVEAERKVDTLVPHHQLGLAQHAQRAERHASLREGHVA
jgi:hypothetical protein